MQKLYEQEDDIVNQEEAEEEDLIMDAITGKPYRPWSPREMRHLNEHLQEEWESAGLGLSTELPVDAHRQRVVSAVRSSQAVVIAGETGCGKTTRIPRFLLEDRVTAGHGAGTIVMYPSAYAQPTGGPHNGKDRASQVRHVWRIAAGGKQHGRPA